MEAWEDRVELQLATEGAREEEAVTAVEAEVGAEAVGGVMAVVAVVAAATEREGTAVLEVAAVLGDVVVLSARNPALWAAGTAEAE